MMGVIQSQEWLSKSLDRGGEILGTSTRGRFIEEPCWYE